MTTASTSSGAAAHDVFPAPAEPTAWAITVEPKAGSPVATGAIISSVEV